MIKKIMVSLVLTSFVSMCFAGYSSGGRSGYSSGSRSYSSATRSLSYSAARSGYNRSTYYKTRTNTLPRSYSSSRSYSGSSANTVIHNNHYGSGGYGFGGGFYGGMLGGYLGGSLANNHHTTVVAGAGAPVVAQGQGMLMEGAPAVMPVQNPVSSIIGSIIGLMFAGLLIWIIVAVTRSILGTNQRSRW